ncbi:MAG: phosphoadenosine phosphosulfate reductase family protein [Thermofilum sp.]|jgi:3'-phosphoadenosine 5'-phosphosulfate sulfotransferase (PAPS reductase)/FAD synthetase|uniref:phosphoadenosine phosphosulfate reductase family protein n=1 Tax=Thermofilum sp. TaxID=1961369 RepID=UPI002588F481|nr:phosphoadenosine phosphosulfate reductase family protein [Thermofilum sp.]MCI4407506.1 phosphoadenosine phosphosulfate reductase family protein [Thermofilum sp.]
MNSNVDKEWLRRWIEYFVTWYDEGNVEEKASEAREFTEPYLEQGIVSVSGGKDSMAMLHILASAKPDLAVFHWDHGPWLMPREVEKEILRNIRRVAPRARLIVKRYRYGETEKARVDWKPWYRAFYGTLAGLGYRYHLVGIRADESSRRHVRGRIVEKRGWTEVYPVYLFTWRDIWSYIFKHRVPVPTVYLRYAKALGWDKVRLVTFFDKEFEKYGSPQLDSVLSWKWKHTPQ